MKLAILSDTHGLLRPEVVEHLKTADAILHGGDINKQAIVDELRQYAPLYIVRGNNDWGWAEDIPHDLTVTLDGVTFCMVHNRKELPLNLAGVDVVSCCESGSASSSPVMNCDETEPSTSISPPRIGPHTSKGR